MKTQAIGTESGLVFKAVKQKGGLFIPNIPYIETDKNNCVWLRVRIEDESSDKEEKIYSFQTLDDVLKITKDIRGNFDEEELKDMYFTERLKYENSL